MDADLQAPEERNCVHGDNLFQHSPAVSRTLSLLVEAYGFARQLNHDVWDFAVEIASLKEQGITTSELRMLICLGYLEHAREVKNSGDKRSFRSTGKLTFAKRSCFVLTSAGYEFARTPNGALLATPSSPPSSQLLKTSVEFLDHPEWDGDRRELRCHGLLVKRFKLPSANQETILMAFQEEGWPPRIDDPLSPRTRCDSKQRLRDTIKGLNRSQKHELLHFSGDGTGEGILWEHTAGSEGD